MAMRPMRPALNGRNSLILHLMLTNIHQTSGFIGTIRTIRHRQTTIPLRPQLLRLLVCHFRRHRVSHTHLAVLRRGGRRRRRFGAICKRLLEDGARHQRGASPAVAVKIHRSVSQRRATRIFLEGLLVLRGRLLGLPLLADVFVGGESQERDVDVEEA